MLAFHCRCSATAMSGVLRRKLVKSRPGRVLDTSFIVMMISMIGGTTPGGVTGSGGERRPGETAYPLETGRATIVLKVGEAMMRMAGMAPIDKMIVILGLGAEILGRKEAMRTIGNQTRQTQMVENESVGNKVRRPMEMRVEPEDGLRNVTMDTQKEVYALNPLDYMTKEAGEEVPWQMVELSRNVTVILRVAKMDIRKVGAMLSPRRTSVWKEEDGSLPEDFETQRHEHRPWLEWMAVLRRGRRWFPRSRNSTSYPACGGRPETEREDLGPGVHRRGRGRARVVCEVVLETGGSMEEDDIDTLVSTRVSAIPEPFWESMGGGRRIERSETGHARRRELLHCLDYLKIPRPRDNSHRTSFQRFLQEASTSPRTNDSGV